ncbi:hypothetical protein ACH6CV_10210 [Bacillota bacterium Meth-B3]
MNTETIMAIRASKRREVADALQGVLTEFGCNIKMRLGLHQAGDVCSEEGLILLQLVDAEEVGAIKALEDALAKIDGLRFKTIQF